jgi:hypothetical protein
MAYYVSSRLDANPAAGRWWSAPGEPGERIAPSPDDAEVVRLVREGLAQQELDESRQYLVGSIPRALETNAAIANFLQIEEFFGLGLDYDVRLPGLLGAVTLDDANAAARRLLDPDRATLVIAGPYEEGTPPRTEDRRRRSGAGFRQTAFLPTNACRNTARGGTEPHRDCAVPTQRILARTTPCRNTENFGTVRTLGARRPPRRVASTVCAWRSVTPALWPNS